MSTAPPRPDAARRGPLVALLAANCVSLVGSQLTLLAIPWFVLQTTGSAAKTGVAGATVAAGYVVTAFFGGSLVDRLGFKRTSVLSDALGAVPVAFVPLLDATVGLAFWELLALVFLGTVATTPGATARQSLIPDVAAMAGTPLERANAAAQAARSGAALAGPLLAGVLIGTIGASRVLWIDAATFAASAVVVGLAIPSSQPSNRRSGGYLAGPMAGIRFIQRHRLVRTLVLIGAGVNALAGALFAVILPIYARDRFGNATAFGLMSAGEGAGALAGALLYGVVGHRLPRRPTYAGCFALAGGALVVLVDTPGLAVTVAVLAVMGLALAPLNPLVVTLLQERIPAESRGQVFGAILAVSNAAAPLGILVAGYVADVIGLGAMLATIAALLVLIAVAVLLLPTFREIEQPTRNLGTKCTKTYS